MFDILILPVRAKCKAWFGGHPVTFGGLAFDSTLVIKWLMGLKCQILNYLNQLLDKMRGLVGKSNIE